MKGHRQRPADRKILAKNWDRIFASKAPKPTPKPEAKDDSQVRGKRRVS